MCRLFGLHADKRVVTATFWLLEAPDNLVEQSKRNPDGTGLGVFEADGKPVVDKQPMAAWQDSQFATEAHELTGTTFIAHVRYSSSAALEVRNTHPFLQDDRSFAHNGAVAKNLIGLVEKTAGLRRVESKGLLERLFKRGMQLSGMRA